MLVLPVLTRCLPLQVYAPVDTDRTLYVFGCNSVDCTETPGSWRVLRDQSEVAAASDTKVPAQATAPPQKNAWDAAGSDSDSSDWGDNDDENEDENDPFASTSSGGGDDAFIDLEKLLLQRDDAMTAATNTTASNKNPKQQSKLNASTNPFTPAATAKKLSTVAFPALPIEVVDEPYEDYTSENDYSHENALLEDYMKQEEEEKSVDVGDLRKIISSAKKSKSGASGGGGAASSSGESYEKTPAQQRHFMRFQKRINRCPLQCLRYDYGGEPLWPVPKPQSIKIPKCVCGEERVFELQLTPTINYFLKVDQFAASPVTVPVVAPGTNAPVVVGGTDTAAKVPAAKGKAAPVPLGSAGGGMDWLSVMVYCCPKSCSRSREEFVVVLAAEKTK